MLKKFCLFGLLVAFATPAIAENNSDLIAQRNYLRQQIDAIDAEITKCEKSVKTWKTATIIGGVGAAASGIGIIAQTQQIKENKKVLNNLNQEVKTEEKAMKELKDIGVIQ